MKKIWKNILWGFILWLICFVISIFVFPLHESNFLLFKTIMIVTGTFVGVYMLFLYFRKVESDYISEGILVGVVWLVINILLDLIVLVGMFKTPVGEYFIGIGLRYLNMPILSIGMSMLLDKKLK